MNELASKQSINFNNWYSKRHIIKASPPDSLVKCAHIYAKGINPFKMSKEFPLMIPLSSAAFSSPYHYLYPCVCVNALFAASSTSSSSCSSLSWLPIFFCVMWLCKWLSLSLFHTYSHTYIDTQTNVCIFL